MSIPRSSGPGRAKPLTVGAASARAIVPSLRVGLGPCRGPEPEAAAGRLCEWTQIQGGPSLLSSMRSHLAIIMRRRASAVGSPGLQQFEGVRAQRLRERGSYSVNSISKICAHKLRVFPHARGCGERNLSGRGAPCPEAERIAHLR